MLQGFFLFEMQPPLNYSFPVISEKSRTIVSSMWENRSHCVETWWSAIILLYSVDRWDLMLHANLHEAWTFGRSIWHALHCLVARGLTTNSQSSQEASSLRWECGDWSLRQFSNKNKVRCTIGIYDSWLYLHLVDAFLRMVLLYLTERPPWG
jgi:hypothetical protein